MADLDNENMNVAHTAKAPAQWGFYAFCSFVKAVLSTPL
jgi:hypothetical protein